MFGRSILSDKIDLACYTLLVNHLKDLNEKQKEAVLHTQGPLLILAGAGAGKTKTISHRILHLIKGGVAPHSILAITFTNKAGKELRERVHKLIENDPELNLPISHSGLPFVSTFHSLGVHILKENAQKLGYTRHFTIYDRADSLSLIKDALKSLGLDPDQYEPGKMLHMISWEKGEGKTLSEYQSRTGNNYFAQAVAGVWLAYETALKKENALDFDDLLLKTAELLSKHPDVRAHYQKVWQYIHIDEYQDTNKVQYSIAKSLVSETKNICVVGDLDQCLPPDTKIKTIKKEIAIKNISSIDTLVSASGSTGTCVAKIDQIRKRKYIGQLVEIQTKKGNALRLTPQHIIFAKMTLQKGEYYVYLMYKRSKGFRIGITQSSRKSVGGDEQVGFLVRCNQEHADRMWILKVCKDRQEAQYYEILFSTTYGIPMLVFHTGGRKMLLEDSYITKLYKTIDTEKRAEQLFTDFDYHFDTPHYYPQGTTRGNTENDRVNIRLTLFSDTRKSTVHPWGLSRVSINTTSLSTKKILAHCGFKTRAGKRKDWRLEITRLDYGEAEKIASKIKKIIPEATILRTALLTNNERFLFQPASNIVPSMHIASYANGKIIEDTVVAVKRIYFSGEVYDLDVKDIHNYIAENIVVHNCIYSWRGADISHILHFEKDFTGAKSILLEQNYRSTKTILAAANQIIKKNKVRVDKNLFTENHEGEQISLFVGYSEKDEAHFVATQSAKLIASGILPEHIAVLYRANFQSRVLEEAFLTHGVPYQVLGTKFFDRKEVKDVISFIRASQNPDSLADIKRVINVPARGIGKTTILKIFSGQKDSLPPAMRTKIDNFYKLLIRIKEKIDTDAPSRVIKFVLAESGLEKELAEGTAEEKERLENIRELATLATKYDIFPQGEGIEKLIEEAALATDQDSLTKNESAVKLMTVHASKGLEFEYVFVTGLETDLFPHKKIGERRVSSAEEEEERRLFYVAITRAKKKLFLSYADTRMIFGSHMINVPSEFIIDIDSALIEDMPRQSRWGGGQDDTNESIVYL